MLSLRLALSSCAIAMLAVFVCSPAHASVVVPANHASEPLAPGASLDDVRMEVEMSVTGGTATMTFTNASVAPEASAVFKTIFLDLTDNDTDTAILWDPVIRSDLSDGSYQVGAYNVLPGFNPPIVDGSSMIELNADNPAPHKGLAPGGSLVVEFDTSLADGSDIDDYLGAFNGGLDTQAYSLGFHAISTDTIEGDGSLSASHIPEPNVICFIAAGSLTLLRRRR